METKFTLLKKIEVSKVDHKEELWGLALMYVV